jgi:hypothetical protein
MNLRLAQGNETAKQPPIQVEDDPRMPHIFREPMAGVSVCDFCHRGKSDRIHLSEAEMESPRWGF